MNYLELRKKYREFSYKSFSYRIIREDLVTSYIYEIKPDIQFKHQVLIKSVNKKKLESGDKKVIDNLVFNIGLVEIPSYWKTVCSSVIRIEAGALDNWQIKWWKKLYMNGMMQYFYTNKIDFREDDFLRIIVREEKTLKRIQNDNDIDDRRYVSNDHNIKPLVTIGGGKDSVVTMDIVAKNFENMGSLVIKPASESAYNVVKAIGLKNIIIHERVFDKKLFELNNQGYLNGHIPYSATLYFISLLSAYIFDYSDILYSNENSSNEGNIDYLGKTVNHQYSKTLEFENDFRDYNQRYLSNIRLFSFLRPLYELQISKLFSGMPQYFNVIRSCNVGQQKGIWCGECPKCLSTYILLIPFLGVKKTVAIIGKDLLNDGKLKGLLFELIDDRKTKPFECVGTRIEIKIALYMTIKIYNGKGLPLLLQLFKDSKEYDPELLEKEEIKLMKSFGKNNLPQEYVKLLKSNL